MEIFVPVKRLIDYNLKMSMNPFDAIAVEEADQFAAAPELVAQIEG